MTEEAFPSRSDLIEIAWDEKALARGRAVYHFTPALLDAFGRTADHDLSSAVGVLQYGMDFVNRPPPRIGSNTLDRAQWAAVWHAEFLELFRVAVHGPSCEADPDLARPSKSFLAEIEQGTADIHWQHALARTRGGAVWRHHALVGSPGAFHALVASLLMDPALRKRACQCRYIECKKFFVTSERRRGGGQPNRLYCSPQHGKDANSDESAARQNKRRARQRLIRMRYDETTVSGAVDQAARNHPDATAVELAEMAGALLQTARKHK